MKRISEKVVESILELNDDDYRSIIRGIRPKDMEYDTYKMNRITAKKMIKAKLRGTIKKEPQVLTGE